MKGREGSSSLYFDSSASSGESSDDGAAVGGLDDFETDR